MPIFPQTLVIFAGEHLQVIVYPDVSFHNFQPRWRNASCEFSQTPSCTDSVLCRASLLHFFLKFIDANNSEEGLVQLDIILAICK